MVGLFIFEEDRGLTPQHKELIMESGNRRGRSSSQGQLFTNRMMQQMAQYGRRPLGRIKTGHIFVQALLAGGFMTLGALLSLLLAVGEVTPGVQTLLLGLGLSFAFFLVMMTNSVMFSDNYVMLPSSFYNVPTANRAVLLIRFWILAWVGNFIGAYIIGWLIYLAQFFAPSVFSLLQKNIVKDLAYQQLGMTGWWQAVLSGVLGNWLICFAMLITVLGRNTIDKYLPLLLASILLVAGGFQYAPVNMGYFSMLMAGHGAGWGAVFMWNLLPASLGNIIGGVVLVSLPIWYLAKAHRS